MKIDKFKTYILEFMLIFIISFALFVLNGTYRLEIAIILVVYTVCISCFLKKRNIESINKKQITILMCVFAIIYLAVFYLLGLYFGYYKASIVFSLWTIKNYIIPISLIIIFSEISRNVLLAQNTKMTSILTFIIMILIDIIIYGRINDTTSLDGILLIVGFVIFSSISSNLLYNYISKRYGAAPIIMFRLITVLYAYIIPFTPDIYIFFRTIARILYPYIIYETIEYAYNKKNPVKASKTNNTISRIILIILMFSIVMLVSCQFRYGVLTVGSGSMEKEISKGDVVFFEKYEKQKIEIGQVIIFYKDNTKVIHRVVDIKNANGEPKYYTKGDANPKNDYGYITQEELIGISKFKIKYIGYPSIWIREMLSR